MLRAKSKGRFGGGGVFISNFCRKGGGGGGGGTHPLHPPLDPALLCSLIEHTNSIRKSHAQGQPIS